ncbi:2-oxoisovalerate dehydrogenase [Candidatus Saganbacteria bacterium]|nr:2-oxoisovalerate dehydrogenase [Candidatus Saganbacteria bacterium]
MIVPEIVFLIEDDPEGGLTAKALGHSIFTQGETLEELKTNIHDALSAHFDKKDLIPSIVRLHIVKEETLAYA